MLRLDAKFGEIWGFSRPLFLLGGHFQEIGISALPIHGPKHGGIIIAPWSEARSCGKVWRMSVDGRQRKWTVDRKKRRNMRI